MCVQRSVRVKLKLCRFFFFCSSFFSLIETIVAVPGACKILYYSKDQWIAVHFLLAHDFWMHRAMQSSKQVNCLTIREAVTIIVFVRVWLHLLYQSSAASKNHVTQQMQMRLFYRQIQNGKRSIHGYAETYGALIPRINCFSYWDFNWNVNRWTDWRLLATRMPSRCHIISVAQFCMKLFIFFLLVRWIRTLCHMNVRVHVHL